MMTEPTMLAWSFSILSSTRNTNLRRPASGRRFCMSEMLLLVGFSGMVKGAACYRRPLLIMDLYRMLAHSASDSGGYGRRGLLLRRLVGLIGDTVQYHLARRPFRRCRRSRFRSRFFRNGGTNHHAGATLAGRTGLGVDRNHRRRRLINIRCSRRRIRLRNGRHKRRCNLLRCNRFRRRHFRCGRWRGWLRKGSGIGRGFIRCVGRGQNGRRRIRRRNRRGRRTGRKVFIDGPRKGIGPCFPWFPC